MADGVPVDLPPSLAAVMLGHMSNGAQLSADDARDLRRGAHLQSQDQKPFIAATAYRVVAEAGSGRTRAETNDGAGTQAAPAVAK
jgi:hypothetical protein